MVITIILGVCIAGYAGYVIYKKIKDMKNGKFCCGGECGQQCCPHGKNPK